MKLGDNDWRAVCVALVAKAISDGGLEGNQIELSADDFMAVINWEFKVEMTELGNMRLTLKEPRKILSLSGVNGSRE
jgi:hypothetical protein